MIMDEHDGFDPSEMFLYRGEGSVPTSVRHVEVDRSVKFIPDFLFERCYQLESVLLHEGLLKIGEYAFNHCTSLRTIQIPSTVTEIGEGAFFLCSNLASVELPAGLASIEAQTFSGCTSLEAVPIPASVAWIGDGAFCGCTNLSSLELREGLRTIGWGAFRHCQSLGSLWIPSSVDEIGEEAFHGCSSLPLVQLNEDLPKMKRFAFGGCTSLECFQFSPLSDRMEGIRMDDQTKSMFESRLSEMALALTRGRHSLTRIEDEEEDEDDGEEDAEALWEKCKESLGRAHEFLTYLELKGAVPVLELTLWKAKIDGKRGEGVQGELDNKECGGKDLSYAGRERKRPKLATNIGQDIRLSREECRVKCGADTVIPEVLKFFTYSSSWPRLDGEEGNVGT